MIINKNELIPYTGIYFIILMINNADFVIVHPVAEKISESMNIVANEPSLAFFRVQEHVRKSLPQLVDQKVGTHVVFQFEVQYGILKNIRIYDRSTSCSKSNMFNL